MRIAIFTLVSTPYFRARFRGAAAQPGAVVDSIELSRLSNDYAFDPAENPEPFERHILSAHPGEVDTGLLIGSRLAAHLDAHRPDVLGVPGWIIPHSFAAIDAAVRRGLPVVLMSESTPHDFSRSPLREWVKRRAVALASSALVGGTPHRAYLRQLGMPDERIFEGYDAVDNEHFARESARWRKQDAPDTPCFLASNRFIEKKNLFRLLEAYAIYHTKDQGPRTKDGRPWPLILLGDGELKPALLAHADKLGLSIAERAPWDFPTKNQEPRTTNSPEKLPSVFFPGFRQIDELPRFLAHAGAFVHASTIEQWGLVVNEAMAGGLPVIVSERCGCAPDLVKAGENGWTFDPLDVNSLAASLSRVAAMTEAERDRLGEASRGIVSKWGPERFGSGLRQAAEVALRIGPRRPGIVDRLLLKQLGKR